MTADLSAMAALLRRYDPPEDELDVAVVLDHADATHRPDGRGRCPACETTWPCADHLSAEILGAQYLGRAADRSRARAAEVLARIRDRKETA